MTALENDAQTPARTRPPVQGSTRRPSRTARSWAPLIGLLAALACGQQAPQGEAETVRAPAQMDGARHVLLVTVDTLRADRIGAYGAPDVRTPRIDGLAAQGTRFTNAIAPMPLTRPSHFSMLTARYPREHGVLNNAMPLPEEASTLAERFRDEGYRTAAFVSVKLLDAQSGAMQGFEQSDAPAVRSQRTAEPTVLALSMIFVRRMIGPVVALERHARALRSGDYTSRVGLRSGRSAFEGLALQLNELATRLDRESPPPTRRALP